MKSSRMARPKINGRRQAKDREGKGASNQKEPPATHEAKLHGPPAPRARYTIVGGQLEGTEKESLQDVTRKRENGS